ncbi:hypothetical protein D3C86_1548680 [compost metagenome]
MVGGAARRSVVRIDRLVVFRGPFIQDEIQEFGVGLQLGTHLLPLQPCDHLAGIARGFGESRVPLGLGQHEVVEVPGHAQLFGWGEFGLDLLVQFRVLGFEVSKDLGRRLPDELRRVGRAGGGQHVRGIDVDGLLLSDDLL